MKNMHRIGIVVAALTAWANFAQATDCVLTGRVGTVNFTDTPRWSNGVPGAADCAIFPNTLYGTYWVHFLGSVTNAAAVFNSNSGGGTVQVQFDAPGPSWTVTNTFGVGQGPADSTGLGVSLPLFVVNAAGNAQEVVGGSGAGIMTLNSPQTNIANQVLLATNATGRGTLTINGTLIATNASGTGQIVVGQKGVGSLIVAGSSLRADNLLIAANPGSTGTLTFTSGSLSVGAQTNALMVITNLLGTSWGGSNSWASLVINTSLMAPMYYPGGLTLGGQAGYNGDLQLNAAQLIATNTTGNATLAVGVNGAGSFGVGGSATVNVDRLTLATNVGSQAALTWNAGATVTIGGNGNTLSNITNLLGTSWGRTSKQAMTINTNITVVAPVGGLLLGETATGTGILTIAAGAWMATNASGTGVPVTWGSGAGTLAVKGGTVVADHVYATNGGNSLVLLQAGTLTTRDSAVLASNLTSTFDIGAGSAPATWNILGGTNLIATANYVRFGTTVGSPGYLNISGNNTLLTINAGLVQLGIANGSAGSRITVSNGATLLMNEAMRIGDAGNGDTKGLSTNLVTDPGSRWVINGPLWMGYSNGNPDNLITVSNGAAMTVTSTLQIGYMGNRNRVVVTGAGSVLNAGSIGLAQDQTTSISMYDSLMISDGAVVNVSTGLTIGMTGLSGNSTVTVNHASCYVTNAAGNATLIVGNGGVWGSSFTNSLVVTNGGIVLVTGTTILGNGLKTNNQIMVSGSGSRLDVTCTLTNGASGVSNKLTIADSGVVTASNLVMGVPAASLGNLINVNNGNLYVTNLLEVGRLGQSIVTLNAGLVQAGQLNVTNAVSSFVLNGGTLATRFANVNNGATFVVGDSTDAATLNLMGGTAHRFANGLFINTNATLMAYNTGVVASATVTGNVTMAQGSALHLDFNASTHDTITIVGALTLPARATVIANALDGSTPWNMTVLSATSLTGVTDLSGWTVSGRYYAHTQGNAVVLTQKPFGTALLFR